MDESTIQQMLMSAYNNDPSKDYVSTATGSINDQTRKRVRDLLSKFSTTGMGRSGISGAATNDIYSNAGQQISQVGAQGEQMQAQNQQNILGKLLGLYEYQDQKTSFGDVLGGMAGVFGGSLLGGAGGALGKGLAGLITGGNKQNVNQSVSNNGNPNSGNPFDMTSDSYNPQYK